MQYKDVSKCAKQTPLCLVEKLHFNLIINSDG